MSSSNTSSIHPEANFQRFHFHRISSTNDYARELLREKSNVIVTADFQWKGRGRNQSSWIGDHGENIYCSFGIKHQKSPEMQALIAYQVAGCLAVQTAIQQHAPKISLRLKYPNDIYGSVAPGEWRKLSGVLVEHEFMGSNCISTVLGIGINVGQREFSDGLQSKATSLQQIGYQVDIDNLCESLIQNVTFLLTRGADTLMEAWRRELKLEQRCVTMREDKSEWRVLEMLPDGRLRLSHLQDSSERIIDNGDSIVYDLNEEDAQP